LMIVTLVFGRLDVTTVAGKVCEVTVWAPDWVCETAIDWLVGCIDDDEVSTGWLRAILPELLSIRDAIWGCDEVRLCILLPDWLRLIPVILLLFAENKN
jgi:hypothetical protein